MPKKVFVSSTAYANPDLREEIVVYLDKLGYKPINHEDPELSANFPAEGRHDKCVRAVEDADAFILIIDKAYGAPYEGEIYKNSPIGYEHIKMSVCWAETLKALEKKNMPIGLFVRQQTWDTRNIFKKMHAQETHKVDLCDNCKNDFIKTGHADKLVYTFLDFLQSKQECWKHEFKYSIDLKDKLGKWLDQTFKKASHSLITQYNSAFIQASDLNKLLGKLYENHSGDIWLFNNDLELIKNEYLFQAIYVDILKKKIDCGAIKSIKIILSSDRYRDFFDPLSTDKNILLQNFLKLGNAIDKIQIACLNDFSDHIDISAVSENLTFYTIDKNLSSPDTVCIIRNESKPYMINPGELTKDDLVIMCRRKDVSIFFDRSKQTIHLFSDNKTYSRHFGSLTIKGRNKSKQFHLTRLV